MANLAHFTINRISRWSLRERIRDQTMKKIPPSAAVNLGYDLVSPGDCRNFEGAVSRLPRRSVEGSLQARNDLLRSIVVDRQAERNEFAGARISVAEEMRDVASNRPRSTSVNARNGGLLGADVADKSRDRSSHPVRSSGKRESRRSVDLRRTLNARSRFHSTHFRSCVVWDNVVYLNDVAPVDGERFHSGNAITISAAASL